MQSKRITLQDIASHGGWSVSTVSYALRGSPKISPETRLAIEAAAQKLGYQPDPALAALAAYRTRQRPAAAHGNLAFITTWGSPTSWSDPKGMLYGCRSFELIFQGVRARSDQLGYTIEHFALPPRNNAAGERLRRILRARGIRGVVILAYPDSVSSLSFNFEDFAVSAIYSESSRASFSFVRSDNYRAIRTAMRTLEARGYRRPGLVVHQEVEVAGDSEWAAGFLSHASQFELGPDPIFTPSTFQREDFNAPMKDWIKRNRLDAVIFGSGAWIHAELQRLGYRIPGDIGLCCLDIIEPDGTVSGFDQNPVELGRAAVTLVHSLLLTGEIGPIRVPTFTHLGADWVEGKTLPIRDPEKTGSRGRAKAVHD